MRKNAIDAVLNITVGDHEYTPDEILSFPTTTMFKQGIKTSNFRLDQQRGVAFYADIAGNIMTDRMGLPLYTLLKTQNVSEQNNDFLSKVAAAVAAAENGNSENKTDTIEQYNKTGATGSTKKSRRMKNSRRTEKTKKTKKISMPKNNTHGASKKDVQEHQKKRTQKNHGTLYIVLVCLLVVLVLCGLLWFL